MEILKTFLCGGENTTEAKDKLDKYPGDLGISNFREKLYAFKMDAAFAHNKAQTPSCDNFERVFGLVESRLGWVFMLFHICGWNMDWLQHTGDGQ